MTIKDITIIAMDIKSFIPVLTAQFWIVFRISCQFIFKRPLLI